MWKRKMIIKQVNRQKRKKTKRPFESRRKDPPLYFDRTKLFAVNAQSCRFKSHLRTAERGTKLSKVLYFWEEIKQAHAIKKKIISDVRHAAQLTFLQCVLPSLWRSLWAGVSSILISSRKRISYNVMRIYKLFILSLPRKPSCVILFSFL